MIFANMHNHSTFSDGVYTPEELVSLAKAEGYGGVILTDHDTVRGTYFMQKAARKAGLLSFLGCEFSTIGFGVGFHLLGFDFNPDEPEMKKLLQYATEKSNRRSKLLFDWAVENGTLKDITWEEVENAFPYNDHLGNDHVFLTMKAKGLLTEKDSTFRDAFSYRFPEREAKIRQIVNMETPDVRDVIRVIRKAGGVPVLAHPHNRLEYIEQLVEDGLMGLEVNHPDLTKEESLALNKMAEKRGIYKTGGTDHSSVLGGHMLIRDRERSHEELFACGAMEDDFMMLYKRQLG